jgi:hypothetical protein
MSPCGSYKKKFNGVQVVVSMQTQIISMAISIHIDQQMLLSRINFIYVVMSELPLPRFGVSFSSIVHII